MTTMTRTDWSDVAATAKQLAGNWQRFECFCWHRRHDLPDAANWMIFYTSSPQSGLIEESNQKVMTDRLAKYAEGDDPDLTFEEHSHWVVGTVTGISLRVFRADCTITDAFREFCRIQEAIDGYPILDEQDYGDREYEATLDNYRNELWQSRGELPDGWEGEVYDWFRDNGHDTYTENRDDQGGWAPREAITNALRHLGRKPTVVTGP
ncbi:MAG: hypothetical protein ABGY75_12205 [Gemmataceae bacterium]